MIGSHSRWYLSGLHIYWSHRVLVIDATRLKGNITSPHRLIVVSITSDHAGLPVSTRLKAARKHKTRQRQDINYADMNQAICASWA